MTEEERLRMTEEEGLRMTEEERLRMTFVLAIGILGI
jgi:hypothetical protein